MRRVLDEIDCEVLDASLILISYKETCKTPSRKSVMTWWRECGAPRPTPHPNRAMVPKITPSELKDGKTSAFATRDPIYKQMIVVIS
jgi:hypothetical protein